MAGSPTFKHILRMWEKPKELNVQLNPAVSSRLTSRPLEEMEPWGVSDEH